MVVELSTRGVARAMLSQPFGLKKGFSRMASPAPAQAEPLPPPMVLMQIAFGKAATQALSVVARFKVADHLKSGPKTAAAGRAPPRPAGRSA